MKKLLAIVLVLCLLLSLAACGEKEAKKSTPKDEKETPAPVSGTTLETPLWTLIYDDTVWTVEEDGLRQGETYANLDLTIPDPEDETMSLIWVTIEAGVEDASGFRDDLVSYGFDQYEYAVNNSYDFTKVGGLDCLAAEGTYWGDPCMRYLNRFESAGTTVKITIVGEYTDERVEALLSGLTFTLTETGNVDFPWAWDGTPFYAENSSAMVATYSVNAEFVPFKDCIVTDETFNHAIAMAGDHAYVLSDGALLNYSFDGTYFHYNEKISLPEEYECVQSTDDGTIWLSNFMSPLISIKYGEQTGSYEDTDYVAMHRSGTWGVSYFTSAECTLLTFADGIMTTSPIVFSDVSSLTHVFVGEDNIFVCGNAADDSGHKIFVYDRDGVLQTVLEDSDGSGLGSVTFVTETPNGYLAADGNMREIVLWANDGTYIGNIDDYDLFGTSYPWFCHGTVMEDGSILLIMTEDRADQSAMELVAFKLTGF